MPTVDQTRRGTSPRSTRMTCATDGRDHLISDQATVAGRTAGQGQYVAICGHLVVAASMVSPPGPSCLDCETALRGVAEPSVHWRRGIVARLLRRQPASAQSPFTTGAHRKSKQRRQWMFARHQQKEKIYVEYPEPWSAEHIVSRRDLITAERTKRQ